MDIKTAKIIEMNSAMINHVACLRSLGESSEQEIAKFEKMLESVVEKAKTLPESFFSSLDPKLNGRAIAAAVHKA